MLARIHCVHVLLCLGGLVSSLACLAAGGLVGSPSVDGEVARERQVAVVQEHAAVLHGRQVDVPCSDTTKGQPGVAQRQACDGWYSSSSQHATRWLDEETYRGVR